MGFLAQQGDSLQLKSIIVSIGNKVSFIRHLWGARGLKRQSILLLILISVSVYANSLLADFIAGDRQFILQNPLVGDFKAVLQSFTADYWGILGGQSFVYYRPFIILTHFIDFNIYGLNPAGHHFSNIIFHTLVTLLVYRLFCGLFPV